MFEYDGRKYYKGDNNDGSVRVAVGSEWIELPLSEFELSAARKALADYDQAMTYVWGRQDERKGATGELRDTEASQKFAQAYAVHTMRYYTDRHYNMHNLCDFYASWLTRSDPELTTIAITVKPWLKNIAGSEQTS